MPERKKLTEPEIRKMEPREADYRIYDDATVGLYLRVFPSGAKSFGYDFRVGRRRRQMTIGPWPDWSLAAARERALALRRDIDVGVDPALEREERRRAPTIEELAARFSEDHLPRVSPAYSKANRSMIDQYVLPAWGKRLVEEITPRDVERLLGDVAAGRMPPKDRPRKKAAKPEEPSPKKKPPRPVPVRANRCGAMLRKMFSLAVDWRMREDNPAARFYLRPEVSRDRYLSQDELDRVVDALASAPDQRMAGIVMLMLLTGARVSEARTARFDQFDLAHGTWTKQAASVKQRRTHRVPVSPEVVSLIRARSDLVAGASPWVFPGNVEGKPVQDIRRFWTGILETAGVADVRIHDLRHSFAAFLVSSGASLEMIGKLLGHTQPSTTQRYAHVMDSPLRSGVGAVAQLVRPRLRVVK